MRTTAKPHLKYGYRVTPTSRSDATHFSGGKPYHRGAECPACRIPLLLLWDIDCSDTKLPPGAFGQLKRVALYFCWRCVNDISYQIVNASTLQVLDPEHTHRESGNPYTPYPEYFEQRRIELLDAEYGNRHPLVIKLARLFENGSDDDGIPQLSSAEAAELMEYYGHPVKIPRHAFHHQLGGRQLTPEWDDVHWCPNPTCNRGIADRIRGRRHAMNFFAGILNNPWGGLPMVDPVNDETQVHWNYAVSVQFHICDRCWTFRGCNRSN